MDDGARRWMIKTAHKNLWRVSAWCDLDDLIQEGYLAYYHSVRAYPDATDPPNRMALFKRVFLNRLHDMANVKTRDIDEICAARLTAPGDDGAEQVMERFAAPAGIEAGVAALASAPKYVQDAVALFATDAGVRRLRSAYRKVPSGRWLRRETLNERLCRLTGYDPAETDIVGGIKTCLEEG